MWSVFYALNLIIKMIALLKVFFGIFAITALVYMGGIDFSVLLGALKNSWILLITGAIIYIFDTSLTGLRWFFLLRTVGIPITLVQSFKIHMIGLFFLIFVPGGVGSDVVKAYYVYKDVPEKGGLALTSIFIDRVIGVYALLVVGVIAVFSNQRLSMENPLLVWNSWFYITILAITTLLICFCFTRAANSLFNARWIKKLPFNKVFLGFFDAIMLYREKKMVLFLCFILSLIIHCLMILVFYFSAMSMGDEAPLSLHAFIVPLLLIFNLVPLTPGGIGVGEVASFTLYNLLGVENGGEIFLLFHLYMFTNALLGAPFYFLYKKNMELNSL